MKQHVLHVIDHTGSGGAQVVIHNLMRAMKDRFSFAVAVLGASGQFTQAYEALGIPVFVLGDGRSRWNPWPMLKLIKTIRREQFDLIHAHLFKSCILGAIAATCTGRRIILHDHTGIYPQSPHHYFSNVVVRYSYLLAYECALHLCDRAIVLTPATAQSYLQHYRVDPQKIAVLPNAVDVQQFSQANEYYGAGSLRAALGLSADTRLVVMVGRLEREKDWWTFLRVARRVRQESGHCCAFLAIGSGSEEILLRDYARNQGLEHVFFLGHRNDVPALLRQADVFLLTSRYEPFGIALVEAMAAGRAVVATRSGGTQNIVTDGVNGLLAPVGDVRCLANHVLSLLRDDGFRQGLAQRARQTVSERYRLDTMAARLAHIYSEVLQQ